MIGLFVDHGIKAPVRQNTSDLERVLHNSTGR